MLKQSSIASFFTQSGPQVTSQLDNPNQTMIENADSDSAADLDNTEIGYELTHESNETENGVVCVDEIVNSTESGACNSQAISDCSSECCDDNLPQPYHPHIDFATSKLKQRKQCHMFKSIWFSQHKWLTYCVTQNKAYCYYCRTAVRRGIICFTKKHKEAFISTGFENWKKAKERFKEHEQCQLHLEACLKLEMLKRTSVATRLSNQLRLDQERRRNILLKLLSSIRYLARQRIPLRGHKGDEGNLFQLLKLQQTDVEGLQSFIDEGQYLSHEIINELIEMMAHQLLRGLLDEIRIAVWFAIIADETSDISHTEQLAISLHWVDTNYIINEDIIALCEAEQTDVATITSTIKDALIRCCLQISQCQGQAYDGAANMAGHLTGVATRLQQEQKSALFVHCVAHSLNLCLQDCGKRCACVREAFGLASELSSIVHASPKRLALFQNIRDQLSPGSPGLKPLCTTRWTVQTSSIDAILKNYNVVCEKLSQIAAESSPETSMKAAGLLSIMEKFEAYFGLKLSHLVFGASEQLSATLQYKDINAQEVSSTVNAALAFLERQQSDSVFDKFYDSVLEEAKSYTEEPTLPRKRKLPK